MARPVARRTGPLEVTEWGGAWGLTGPDQGWRAAGEWTPAAACWVPLPHPGLKDGEQAGLGPGTGAQLKGEQAPVGSSHSGSVSEAGWGVCLPTLGD